MIESRFTFMTLMRYYRENLGLIDIEERIENKMVVRVFSWKVII